MYFMSTMCGRPQGGRGSGPRGHMWTEGGGVKNVIFLGRHKWMAPNLTTHFKADNTSRNNTFLEITPNENMMQVHPFRRCNTPTLKIHLYF